MQFYAVFIGCPHTDAQTSLTCTGDDLDTCRADMAPYLAEWLSRLADFPLSQLTNLTPVELLEKARRLGFWTHEMTESNEE